MSRIFKFVAITFAAATIAGCGDTLGEQALYGAGAGAATAAVLDGDIATGAVVGAAGNALFCQTYPSRCR